MGIRANPVETGIKWGHHWGHIQNAGGILLTETEIRALKPREKPYKKFDGEGLYIEVMPDGAKRWRLKYRFAGKEPRLALGASR